MQVLKALVLTVFVFIGKQAVLFIGPVERRKNLGALNMENRLKDWWLLFGLWKKGVGAILPT